MQNTQAYQEFLAFVLDNARNVKLIAAALEGAVPLLTGIQTDDFCPLAASQIDNEKMAAAIKAATGRPVKRIVTLSLAELAGRDTSVGDTLRARINGTSLGDRLIDHHADSLWRGLKDIDRYRLYKRLSDIEKPAVVSSGDGVWSKIGMGLNSRIWSNVDESVYYLFGQALAGNRRKVKKLLPLCRLLSDAIPLGEHKDEPGTWYVLVA